MKKTNTNVPQKPKKPEPESWELTPQQDKEKPGLCVIGDPDCEACE